MSDERDVPALLRRVAFVFESVAIVRAVYNRKGKRSDVTERTDAAALRALAVEWPLLEGVAREAWAVYVEVKESDEKLQPLKDALLALYKHRRSVRRAGDA